MRKRIILDMHCDTLYRLRKERAKGNTPDLRRADGFCVDLEKLKAGGCLGQCFAVYIDLRETDDPYADAMELVRLFQEEMEKNPDRIRPAATAAQLEENLRKGRMSAILTLEEGGMCKGRLSHLEEFFRLGARMMTLVWNYENELGYPAVPAGRTGKEPGKGGLKETGFLFLEAMEALGMIPDVSHLSDEGFYDCCRFCRKPFAASHSNARALCRHGRNLSDEMLRLLGEHGGVAGLNYYPLFLTDRALPGKGRTEKGALEKAMPVKPLTDEELLMQIAAHARHMIRFAGREGVGLGSDFDGFEGKSAPSGADRMEDLIWAFHRAGLTEDEIDGILYRNVLRLYRETFPAR